MLWARNQLLPQVCPFGRYFSSIQVLAWLPTVEISARPMSVAVIRFIMMMKKENLLEFGYSRVTTRSQDTLQKSFFLMHSTSIQNLLMH